MSTELFQLCFRKWPYAFVLTKTGFRRNGMKKARWVGCGAGLGFGRRLGWPWWPSVVAALKRPLRRREAPAPTATVAGHRPEATSSRSRTPCLRWRACILTYLVPWTKAVTGRLQRPGNRQGVCGQRSVRRGAAVSEPHRRQGRPDPGVHGVRPRRAPGASNWPTCPCCSPTPK